MSPPARLARRLSASARATPAGPVGCRPRSSRRALSPGSRRCALGAPASSALGSWSSSSSSGSAAWAAWASRSPSSCTAPAAVARRACGVGPAVGVPEPPLAACVGLPSSGRFPIVPGKGQCQLACSKVRRIQMILSLRGPCPGGPPAPLSLTGVPPLSAPPGRAREVVCQRCGRAAVLLSAAPWCRCRASGVMVASLRRHRWAGAGPGRTPWPRRTGAGSAPSPAGAAGGPEPFPSPAWRACDGGPRGGAR